MLNRRMPLNYAIMKLFEDGRERCAEDVVRELEPAYSRYRLLTEKGVDEALATAKENGLLNETGAELSERDRLRLFFRISDYGLEMIRRYL